MEYMRILRPVLVVGSPDWASNSELVQSDPSSTEKDSHRWEFGVMCEVDFAGVEAPCGVNLLWIKDDCARYNHVCRQWSRGAVKALPDILSVTSPSGGF